MDAFPKAKIKELPPKAKRELAMLQIMSENQFEDEMVRSEHAVMNAADIIVCIIRLIAHFL